MDSAKQSAEPRKRQESLLFVFLVVFLFPILAVLVVGGFGFAVWILQILFGPPGAG